MKKLGVLWFLLAAVLMSACEPAAPYDGNSASKKLFFTGDSLTNEAAPHLKSMWLSNGYQVAARYHPGTNIDYAGRQVMKQIDEDRPNVVVVLSGTNNRRDGWTASDQNDLEVALSWMSKADCAVWVTPAAHRHHFQLLTIPDTFGRVASEQISKAAGNYPNVHVARWDQRAAYHPEWYDSDTVHHTAQGRLAYAEFAVSETKQLCG